MLKTTLTSNVPQLFKPTVLTSGNARCKTLTQVNAIWEMAVLDTALEQAFGCHVGDDYWPKLPPFFQYNRPHIEQMLVEAIRACVAGWVLAQ